MLRYQFVDIYEAYVISTQKRSRCDKLHEAVNLVKDDLPFVKLI